LVNVSAKIPRFSPGSIEWAQFYPKKSEEAIKSGKFPGFRVKYGQFFDGGTASSEKET
jgi:hypothetical protein